MGFVLLDWIVIGIYFLVLLGVAWWVIRQKQKSTTQYFLAGRNIGWFVIGASIFASNIGSEHLVGLAGAGAKTGVVLGHYELHSWLILLLGWVFVPFYLRSQVFTMPEFLERRYAPNARWFLSLVMLVGYVLTKVSVTVYAGGVVIQGLMGIDFWTGAIAIVILTGLYTVLGGLRAVLYTEALQTFVLIAGSVAVTAIGLHQLGGWESLREIAGSEHFNMFKPASDPDFPWPGMIFAPPIVGLWYWCTDQYIVQRTLAAANEKEARRGTIFAGYLKILPIFIFIVPGIIAFALAKTGKINLPESDQALPVLVSSLLPAGFRGLVAGGLLAALMSSLAAVFNSCSTLFTMDIYKKLKPKTTEKDLVFIGRVATIVVVALGIAWIPFMRSLSGQLYTYLQNVQAYIAPPIAAVFLLGLFFKRINALGAISALVSGFVLGMIRLVMELNKESLSGIFLDFANINFLYFAIILFVFCIGVLTVVSLLSKPPSDAQIRGLTFATTGEDDREKSRASWNKWDVANSVIIVGFIVLIFAYFTG